MILVKAIVRPEKSDYVLAGLLEAGYPAVTKVPVFGRGKQRGLKVGDVHYDELPKEMLLIVVHENDKNLFSIRFSNAPRPEQETLVTEKSLFNLLMRFIPLVQASKSKLTPENWRMVR